MKHKLIPGLWLLATATMACGDGARQPAKAEAAAGKNGYNACRLLQPPEIEALTEKQVLMANVVEAAPERSVCHWEDASGIVFKITVYWTGGKQGWDTWRAAQGMSGAMLNQAEGVHPDSIIKQGVVPGLGDAAYFSELLPSLLLKHDTLVEMEMSLIPHPETKFRTLATLLLPRM
jgi:hypothetical protein